MNERAKELLLELFKEQDCVDCTLNDFCKENDKTVCSILVDKYIEFLRHKKKWPVSRSFLF